MKVLVTGGGGFIGGHVCAELTRREVDFTVIDRRPVSDWTEAARAGEAFVADISELGGRALAQAMGECGSVIHRAAEVDLSGSFKNPLAHAWSNAYGSTVVAHIAAHQGKPVVYSSTCAVYAHGGRRFWEEGAIAPASPYASTKYAGELVLRNLLGDLLTVCRLFNVYGAGQKLAGEGMAVPSFATRSLQDLPHELHGGGEQGRDFVPAPLVAFVLAQIALEGCAFDVMNVGTGRGTQIRELSHLVHAAMGTSGTVATALRPGDSPWVEADVDRLTTFLGDRPQRAWMEPAAMGRFILEAVESLRVG